MKNHSPKLGTDMPGWARSLAAAAGIALAMIGLLALFAIRPLRSEILVLAITGLGLATDFLQGAVYGRWPVLIHFWI
jgi:hypothetical protein